MDEVQKSDRLRWLEEREASAVSMTIEQEQELENLRAAHIATLANLDRVDEDEDLPGYNTAQIDYGYHPRDLTEKEMAVYERFAQGRTPSPLKLSLWQRIKAVFHG